MWRRKRMMEELERDIRDHIARETQENVDRGMPPDEARFAALRKFGNVLRAREDTREIWSWVWLEQLLQDLRFGLRMLRKSPGFTAIAILTLALGIGANTAIFALVDALYLKPLNVSHPEELVRVYARGPADGYGAGFSVPEFEFVRSRVSSFADLAAETQVAQLHVILNGDSQEVRGAFTSTNYFNLLGIQARMGRTFAPDEGAVIDRDAVAVISDQFWEAHFSSNPAAVGSEIHVNRTSFRVIGIAPPGFHGDVAGNPVEIWLLTSMLRALNYACDDGTYNCTVYDTFLGRLAPSRSLKAAQAELRSTMMWTASNWPEQPSRRQIVATTASGVEPDERRESDVQMNLLMSVTASLLLIGCANLAGLLLARAAARKKEIAVRLSIGANRGRIVRQLLAESLLLAAAGGGVGLCFSLWARDILSKFYAVDSEGFHHLYNLSLDGRVLAYSIVVAIIAAISFGLTPAVRASRQDLVTELKEGGSAGLRNSGWLRNGLVVAQITLSMTLVGSAVLLVRTGRTVQRGTNFDPQHVVLLRLRPELIQYTPPQVESLVRHVTQILEATADVQSVGFMEGGEGLVWHWGSGREVEVSLPGEGEPARGSALRVVSQDVNSRFFEAMRIPLLQGRPFTDEDSASSPRVAIVNATLAGRLWLNASAIGRTLVIGGEPYQVVGVAADIQPPSRYRATTPKLYRAYWQSKATTNGDIRMAIRIAGNPAAELPAIRNAIQTVDPIVPIGEEMSLADQMRLDYMPILLARSVMTFCGLLALILSAIGVYSVLAFVVQTHTREIGIRMALGAHPANVLGLVVAQCMKMTAVGIAVGYFVEVISARLLASLLYGVTPTDPATFLAVSMLLTIVALVACWIPARRAMRVDPIVALRYE